MTCPAEVQAIVNPITTKLYSAAGPSDDDQEAFRDHDEL